MEAELQHYRLFLAIQTSEKVQENLGRVQTKLMDTLAEEKVRWTPREQFHLTLRFFGNVDTERLVELANVLQKAAQRFSPLTLAARQVGCFPNARRPRVLWAEVQETTRDLERLWLEVQAATAEFGEPPDHDKFAGHITLGRVKFISRRGVGKLEEVLRDYEALSLGTWTAEYMELMRSQLSSDGAVHEVLERVKLGG